MFFLKQPNSQVSIDIPVVGFFDEDAKEAQLQPGILITTSIEDWLNGHDEILQTALAM